MRSRFTAESVKNDMMYSKKPVEFIGEIGKIEADKGVRV